MQLVTRHALLTFVLTWSLCAGGGLALGQEDVLGPPADLFGPDNGAEGAGDAATDGTGQGTDAFSDPGAGFGTDPSNLTPNDQQVEEAYNQGKQLADQGDYEGAIQQFSVALTLNQRHVPSMLELGRAHKALGNDDFAIEALTRAATNAGALDPEGYSAAVFELGDLNLDRKRFPQAIDQFGQLLRRNPANPVFAYKLGLAHAEQAYSIRPGIAQRDTLTQAVQNLDRAIELKPDYAEAFYERGTARLQLNEIDDAVDDLEESFQLDGSKPDVIAQVGVARLRRAAIEADSRNGDQQQIITDYERAIEALGKYFELAPEPSDDRDRDRDEDAPEITPENAHVFRAIAYIGLGDEMGQDAAYYQKAIEDCDLSIAIEPENPLAYYERGVAERMIGRLDDAVGSLTESVQLNPTNTEAYLRRGIVWFRTGDYELALSDFEAAAAAGFNRDPRVNLWAGLTQHRLGDFKAAVSQYSLALGNRNRFPIASLNRGIAYMQLGRYDRAISDFNEVLRYDLDNEQALSYRKLASQLRDGQANN